MQDEDGNRVSLEQVNHSVTKALEKHENELDSMSAHVLRTSSVRNPTIVEQEKAFDEMQRQVRNY